MRYAARRSSRYRSASTRSFRRRYSYRGYRRGPARSYSRRYRRMRKASTKVITFVTTITPAVITSTTPNIPLQINPSSVPGFGDWLGVMSQYRILSCTMQIERTDLDGNLPSLIIAPSAEYNNYDKTSPTANFSDVIPITFAQVEQLKGAKVVNPNTTRTSYFYRFRPYKIRSNVTTVSAITTASIGVSTQCYPYYGWFNTKARSTDGTVVSALPEIVWGPYIATREPADTITATLKMKVQFKGQQ